MANLLQKEHLAKPGSYLYYLFTVARWKLVSFSQGHQNAVLKNIVLYKLGLERNS